MYFIVDSGNVGPFCMLFALFHPALSPGGGCSVSSRCFMAVGWDEIFFTSLAPERQKGSVGPSHIDVTVSVHGGGGYLQKIRYVLTSLFVVACHVVLPSHFVSCGTWLDTRTAFPISYLIFSGALDMMHADHGASETIVRFQFLSFKIALVRFSFHHLVSHCYHTYYDMEDMFDLF
jgi:hypothetical protein